MIDACVDSEARRRAIETLDRPLLVEAGAGTGKTSLLVARVVHAVEAGAVRMGRIAAISFTEKAAAELRLRIRDAIEKRHADPELSPGAAERLGVALHELDRARLCTIHAFAAGILREQPVQARVDPRFHTLDEMESARFFREVWDHWVDAQLEDESAAARLRPLLLAGVRLEPDLFVLARELELQRDVLERLVVPQRVADLEDRLRALCDDMLACVAHAEAHCRDPADEGLRRLRVLGATLEPLASRETSSWPDVFLGELRLGATAGRKESWAAGRGAESKEWRRRLQTELDGIRSALSDTLLHEALLWLEAFRTAYAAEKRRRGLLDFQDLLVEAQRLVRDHPDVRRELGGRLDMLCVDEFQDTDPLQAELVLFLGESGGPAVQWTDVRVGPKLFLVGDPKQSIYRFRRADLDIYERCARIVEDSGGERLDIRQNFRSRPAVLHWTNATFETLFGTGPMSPAPGPRHQVLVPGVEAGSVPAVWILRGNADLGGENWRQAEAAALAAWVRQALEGGFPVRAEEGERPLRPGDVAMLFARTSGIEHYEAALRDAGLPFQQEGGRLFFRRQEVRDVLHALAAIDDPHDALSIVAALRSPLFGTSDEELWLHRASRAGFSYLDSSPGSPLESRFALLAALHAERHARGIAATITAFLDRTEARAVYAARPLGAQALANVEMLERLARRFEASRPAGLREFLRSLRDVDEDAPRIAEWTPEEDSGERVRLLTVHVAKGLDFPCVLLANLASNPNRRGGPLVVDRLLGVVEARLRVSEIDAKLETRGYAAAREIDRQRDESEESRLLYVAATRARDYLVVPCFHGRRASGLLESLARVPAALAPDGAAFGDLGAPAQGFATGANDAWSVVERRDLVLPERPQRPKPEGVDLRALWAERAAWRGLHAARLERAGAPRPAAFALKALALDPAADASRNARQAARLQSLLGLAIAAAPARGIDALDELARTHGAPDLAAALRRAYAVWGRSELGRRVAASARVFQGVRCTVQYAGACIETCFDLVFATDAGVVLVELGGEGADSEPDGLERALVSKALLLRETGAPLLEAGIFFMDDGRYVPLADLDARVEALHAAVDTEAR